MSLTPPADAGKNQSNADFPSSSASSSEPSSPSFTPPKLFLSTSPSSPDPAQRNPISTVSSATPHLDFLSQTKNAFYDNRGLFLILFSQFCGSLMALIARLLATGPQKFHALQILFVRQTITAAGCFLWMWRKNVPYAPFGPREVRWLLVARGLGGFWGVFGLYYSLTYLDLADATVVTFLAPIVATWACSLIPSLKEPFTKHEFFAGVTSLSGVVLIVRPGSLFFHAEEEDIEVEQQGGEKVTPHQRLVAVLIALVGVLGTASTLTIIRVIGKRAHPLISVNYFSSWCAAVSLVSLTTIPSVGGIIWPRSAYQWALLCGICVSGFVMQFCLTRGLQLEKTGRGTNMIYSSMIFALFWEKMVWGTTPGWLSIMGSALILSSAVYVGTRKSKQNEVVVRGSGDEEVGLMSSGVEMVGRN
ncbi:hypothetical protein BDD12DRAFT_835911 [Trichophaea hybrida]|nr:hypothetical protein BDD12DRAFT_835911 [Trichophaea hybrida]